MVSCCWSYGLVVHVQFGLVRTPKGQTGGLSQKKLKNLILCLRGLIMVLFCKIHDLVVQCASLVLSRYPLDQEGDIV